jgi:hypothetical protein
LAIHAMRSKWERRPHPLLAFLGTLAMAGCGAAHESVFPVKGELYYQGKPAAGAVVFFHPVNAKTANAGNPASDPTPTGRVRDDGSFELTTHSTNDGAPPGQYRVGVVWTRAKGGGDDVENLLPLKFMDPHKSGLPIIDVRAEPNVVPAFRISG